MTIAIKRFNPGFFPVINAAIFALLFWLVTGEIKRDPTNLAGWVLGGAAAGFILGLVWRYLLKRVRRTSYWLFGLIGIAEFALGLLLIGPAVWLQMRFIPISNLHSICCETPKDYGAENYETFSINTPNSGKIAGWYVAPTTQAGKAIILIHGYGYDRRGTDFQTRILIAAGYGVLLYDLRDHGESTGPLNNINRMDNYQQDLQQVTAYLRQQPGIQQVGVVGISLGAFTTLNLPASVLNEFSGLWMDGLRFENFGAQRSPQTPKDYLDLILDRQIRWLAHVSFNQPTTQPLPTFTQIIPQITKPQLMLVASGMDPSERYTNEQFIPLMGGNKKLWIIEKAWHIGGRFEVPDEYKEKLLAFFEGAFSQPVLQGN